MSTKPETAAPSWGYYSPTGYRRLLRQLVHLGLARGSLKRWFYRQWSAAGGREPVDITSHQLKFRVHPWDNTVESKLLLGSRSRDREELDQLARHLPSGGTFLDIGANIGFYSLVAAACGAGRVLAIEPLPTAFQRLEFNIRANGFENRIVALNAAVGAVRKQVPITLAQGDMGSSSIVKTDLVGEQVEVPMLPLADALMEQGFTHVDVMKIDVEGMEDSVLCPFFKTAPRTLWPGWVIMEDVHRGNWREDVIGSMKGWGYEQVGKTGSNAFLQLSQAPRLG